IGPIIHRHPMRFYEVVEKSKKNHYCEACRLVHSGPCYSCTTFSTAHTEYYLHENSAKLPYEIQHPFHSSHPLILRTYHYRRGLIICDECRDVCRSLFYSCDECDFKLDVKCATLTTHKTDVLQPKKMESVAELNHFNHPHKLVFGNCSDPLWKESCTVCQLPIFGPAYYCLNFRCIFKVHEFCLGMPQKMQVENNFDPDKNSAQRLFFSNSALMA
ncbi:DC1 - like 10, partial [Theobroma cacao]